MSKSVFCIATRVDQANRIVQTLLDRGVSPSQISVLLPEGDATGEIAHVKSSKASEGVTAGVTAGGLTGGALGLLAGIGALAIPGVGPLIAAGPIMAALSGAAVGAAGGGLVGGLIGLGIPEIEARRYEGRLREGNYLISVHTEDGDEAKRVKDIFDDTDAEDVSTIGEASVPKESGD